MWVFLPHEDQVNKPQNKIDLNTKYEMDILSLYVSKNSFFFPSNFYVCTQWPPDLKANWITLF